MMPETVTGDAFDPVARNGGFGDLAGNGQPETGIAEGIGTSKHGEVAVAGSDWLSEDASEGVPASQPGAARKARAIDHGSGRQPGAALGATRTQNPAAALGGHAGAKPMGALAVNDAGLESTLHGDSLEQGSAERKRGVVFK